MDEGVDGEASGLFEKAAAFGKAIGKGTGADEDVYSWQEGVAVEPWAEAVDGKALLDALVGMLNRYVVLGQW
ncbi:MAG TPA: hypothetical protein VG146_02250 [Verrucomicrobiae bacterium]|nr:hypothetical protein [Verrucomicrobiae bacterium]